jgi:hypothetical protein
MSTTSLAQSGESLGRRGVRNLEQHGEQRLAASGRVAQPFRRALE